MKIQPVLKRALLDGIRQQRVSRARFAIFEVATEPGEADLRRLTRILNSETLELRHGVARLT